MTAPPFAALMRCQLATSPLRETSVSLPGVAGDCIFDEDVQLSLEEGWRGCCRASAC